MADDDWAKAVDAQEGKILSQQIKIHQGMMKETKMD